MEIDAARLKVHVSKLSEEFVPRDSTQVATLNRVAAYIGKEFAQAQGRVEEQPFDAGGSVYRNIIASFGPSTGERLIVGAHYDVCGPHPGADDNASGVAGLLELARVLGANPPAIRVDLVGWALEEPPYFASPLMGSAIHAAALAKAGVPVRGAISLEMIGYFTDKPKSQRYPVPGFGLFYPSRGNFILVAGRFKDSRIGKPLVKAMRKASVLPVERFSGPTWTPSLDWSDHRSYWPHGWPAVMVTDTSYLRNANYHQATDTAGTLDYDRMAMVVQGVAAFVRREKPE